MRSPDTDALCQRHGLELVEILPSRSGASLGVYHVRNAGGEELLVKVTQPEAGPGEVAALRAVSGCGATPRFVAEPEPGVYLAEWLPGRTLADVPAGEPVDAAAIGRVVRAFHGCAVPAGLDDVRQRFRPGWTARWIHLSDAQRALGERIATALYAYRPSAPALLHGDLAPTNVLLTPEGPRLIDPVGRWGLAAWDLAQLAVAANGRGRPGMLPALVQGYGGSVRLLAEMVAWMVLFYLDKNLATPKSPFNGLITNDKFCLTRQRQLRLSWPRARVLGRRAPAAYLPDELSHRGGGHETPVAGAPIHASVGRCPAALGSGLSAPPVVDDGASARAAGLTGRGAVPSAGGVPCA